MTSVIEERYRKLRRLADDVRTPAAEAELARKMADSMIEKYPDLSGLGTGETIEIDIAFANQHEEEAIAHLGRWLGLDPYTVRARTRAGRVRKKRLIRLEGPRESVEIAVELWPHVRRELRELLRGTVAGWLGRSMHYEPPDHAKGEEWKPTETELAGLRAGAGAASPFANPGAGKLKG